ncbi:sensor histidine kinase [Nocardia sp. 2YAB30]|uniref:sensor histidine kinase n=1 Tax=unclassified Nocardia TaxID=2637762 RepID=UPI003F9C88BF
MTRLALSARPSHWGLRVRSAAVVALVVGVATLVGAGVVLRLLDLSLLRVAGESASARANAVAEQLRTHRPDQLDESLFASVGRVTIVQIIGPDGHVLRTSSQAWTAPLIGDPITAGVDRRNGVAAASNEDLRISARTVAGPDGSVTVLAAADTQPIEDTVADVTQLLAGLGPLIVLVTAAATYWLVGRSLRSVEDIRARVAGIETGDLSQRVPIPPTRDEIARLAVTMNEMLSRIQAGHEAQRRFVGDASHELRSPLTTLLTALELGLEHPGFLDRDLLADTLLPEGRRMRHLIDDLLILAVTDQHGPSARHEDIDLDDLAAAAVSAADTSHAAIVRAELVPARVVGDRTGIDRVIRNLVDNAARHATTTVTVSTAVVQGRARLTVDDDGPGVPPDDRVRIFERFARLEPDRSRDSGGTGLGLAIVAEIVAAHHGTVTVENSPTGGARFVVELPTTEPPPTR